MYAIIRNKAKMEEDPGMISRELPQLRLNGYMSRAPGN